MIDDPGDFLGVSLEDSYNLFCVLVKYSGITVIASRQYLAGIGCMDVKGKDTWDTGTVQTLYK